MVIRKGAFAVISNKENKVFLMRRSKKRNIGEWEFPGGKVDPGETVPECMIRELHEETGIRVTGMNLVDLIVQSPRSGFTDTWIVAMFSVREYTGTPKIMEDVHDQCGWFSWDEIRNGVIPLADNARDVFPYIGQF